MCDGNQSSPDVTAEIKLLREELGLQNKRFQVLLEKILKGVNRPKVLEVRERCSSSNNGGY